MFAIPSPELVISRDVMLYLKNGFLIIMALLLWPTPSNAYHIMLDPGHGGVDTGAVRGPAKEADLVLKVATQLKRLLEQDSQFQVSLTRTNDSNISLSERVKKADRAKADLFVSLHANAAVDARAKGVEFYFQNTLPPDEESLYLASLENQEMKAANSDNNEAAGGTLDPSDEPSKKGDVAAILEDLHRQHRIESSLELTRMLTSSWEKTKDTEKVSIKQAPFFVISQTNMPAVLIEIGFITNPAEVKKLLTAKYQLGVAKRIQQALVAFKEKGDKESLVRQSLVE